jgi:hypothetical protein
MNKINDELKELSPLLRDLKQRDDGFRLPEGYFEAVEESVFGRMEAAGVRRQPKLESRQGGLFARLFQPSVMWAAAAVALALAAIWFFKPQTATNENLMATTAPELTAEEIETYVLENINDFDAAQLAAVSAEELVPTVTNPSPVPEKKSKELEPVDDFSEEELELLLKEMSEEELKNLLET